MVTLGKLQFEPVLERETDVAPVVFEALKTLGDVSAVGVSKIDPSVSDTAAFCEAYGVEVAQAANCVVLRTKKGEEPGFAACVILASTRADINNKVCEVLGIKKASFAQMEDATAASAMEYGAITPIGLPVEWPVLIDAWVAQSPYVIIGSGIRSSKIAVPGSFLAALPNVQVIEGLANPRE